MSENVSILGRENKVTRAAMLQNYYNFSLRIDKNFKSIHSALHYLSFNPWLPGCCVSPPAQRGRKTPTQRSSINKGQWKGTLGSLGTVEEGKLAHIRLIRGPQSPLTFASQSQVAGCLRREKKKTSNRACSWWSPDFRTTDSVCFYIQHLQNENTP